MTNDPRREPIDIEQARDLLAPYALGALDAIEREQLESVLADWPEGRRELADLKFTAASLAFIPEQDATPALGLEGRIIARARAERSDEQRDRRFRKQLTWYPAAHPPQLGRRARRGHGRLRRLRLQRRRRTGKWPLARCRLRRPAPRS